MSGEAALNQIAAAQGRLSRDYIADRVRAFQATYAVKDCQGRAALL